MPKYSVVIPAYNSGETIARCINSILRQGSAPDAELIVVDDASSDNTVSVAKALGAKVIGMPARGGPSKARNAGAKAASGDILIFVDSDVLFFEDTFLKIKALLKEDRGLCAFSCNLDPQCEMKDAPSRYKHLYMCYSLIKQPTPCVWVFTSTFVIKKVSFENVGGFNENLSAQEDELLGRELLKKGCRITFAKDIPVRHFYTDGDQEKQDAHAHQALKEAQLHPKRPFSPYVPFDAAVPAAFFRDSTFTLQPGLFGRLRVRFLCRKPGFFKVLRWSILGGIRA
jgi:glycosyltransferase involved in cell wall biosynthesis